MTSMSRTPDDDESVEDAGEPFHRAEELEDGSLDPDQLDEELAWWDEGSDDET